MNYLKTLQYLINFFFFGFFFAVFAVIFIHIFTPAGSFYDLLLDLSKTGFADNLLESDRLNYLTLTINLIRFLLFTLILIFFRKAVMKFVVGKVFDEVTRKNLKYMGIFTVLLGCLKMFAKVWVPYFLDKGITIFSLNFTGFGSTYFIIALGLFFIYMSKVLEESAILQQENELTI